MLQTIQPVGFHVGVSGDWQVTAASANLGDFLAFDASAALGRPITTLFSNDAVHDIRNRMALLRSDDAIEHLFQFPLVDGVRAFDLALFRDGSGFGIDAEPADERGVGNATGVLDGMLARVAPSDDIGQLCDQASTQLRALTGFQQVVISGPDGLLGHATRAGPAPSDTDLASAEPDMVVFDRDAAAIPVHVLNPGSAPRKLTMRSPIAVEIAQLESIGASAALRVPLRRGGQPWGQAACYHNVPRHVSAERRSIARLFATIMSLRIEIAELRGAP